MQTQAKCSRKKLSCQCYFAMSICSNFGQWFLRIQVSDCMASTNGLSKFKFSESLRVVETIKIIGRKTKKGILKKLKEPF